MIAPTDFDFTIHYIRFTVEAMTPIERAECFVTTARIESAERYARRSCGQTLKCVEVR